LLSTRACMGSNSLSRNPVNTSRNNKRSHNKKE
jgi:hypothetical protein